jgi:hypothetical protein
MNALKQMFGVVVVLSLGGCAADAGSSTVPERSETVSATSEQALTIVDCQNQVASCVKSAKSFLDLGGCTASFQACTTQAAADLAGQSNLLKSCRTSANACLQGALTLSDIKACRSVFDACAADVQSTATDAVAEAIKAAKDAIDKATNIAVGVIQDASGVATGALDALATCTKQADSCLAAVVSLNGISTCQASFEKCAGAAVALVDKVVAPLPVPTPTEIANALAPCQTKAQACLKGAVTATDISACQGALQTCVKNVTSVADSTVDDVNKLLPPAIQLPTPTQTVDCSTAATQCLLNLGNPIDCANQAAKCLGP